MASNNMINFKVFLRDDTNSEARRFTVDASAVTSFLFMKEKLQAVFPVLRKADFQTTWKDADGDEITITSDEDLITALTEMSGSVKVLSVTLTQRRREPAFGFDAEAQGGSFGSPSVVCDVCNQTITGLRYKCLQCPDYDLCAGCEHQGHHSEHLMVRAPNADVFVPRCARKFVHHFAQSLKKSAYAASKEAHRAAKHATRFAKPAGEEAKTEQAQPQASTNNQNTEGPQGCPFSAGEAFNMNDVHALGAMARDHLGPLLEAFQAPSAPSAPSGNNPDQGGLIMDLIRNAVDGFFGRVPGSDSNPQQQPEKQAAAQNATNEQTSAMDVEGAAAPQPDNAEKSDPSWTFVQPNQPKPTAQPENPKVVEGLKQLHEMGFSNEGGYLTRLLERYDGNVTAVVKAIVEQSKLQ